MKIHRIAGVLCPLQAVTNLGTKCNQTCPSSGSDMESYDEDIVLQEIRQDRKEGGLREEQQLTGCITDASKK